MPMFEPSRKTLIAVCAVAASAAGGAALAGAATNSSSSSANSTTSTTKQRDKGPARQALTGDAADKVTAAAKAKVPGGTVLRAEAGGPYSTPYHAHVRKSDGTEVVVLVNSSFEATSTQARPAGRGGHGGRGHGGPGGRGGETELTGDTAAKVTAAAKAKVPGGTVLRVENDADSTSPYEAHVRKSDGTEVVVLVNKDFEATSVTEHKHP